MGFDNSFPFPNPVMWNSFISSIYIYETSNVLGGKMPGIFIPNEYTNGVFYSRDKTVIVNGKDILLTGITNSNIQSIW